MFFNKLLPAVLKMQTIQDSVFALEKILMIQIMLEAAVLKIQTPQELAVGLHNASFFNHYSNPILF